MEQRPRRRGGGRTCGFPDPIMMKRAGCTMEMPSRSTVFTPLAELSRTTSTWGPGRWVRYLGWLGWVGGGAWAAQAAL